MMLSAGVTAAEVLRCVGEVLAILFLLVILGFIGAVCAAVWLRAIFRPEESERRARRFRLPKNRTPRRTLIITPSHKDPLVVGDVTTQAYWPRG